MEYFSSFAYSQKFLHSIYYSSIPPLPIPKNYQKECSLISEFGKSRQFGWISVCRTFPFFFIIQGWNKQEKYLFTGKNKSKGMATKTRCKQRPCWRNVTPVGICSLVSKAQWGKCDITMLLAKVDRARNVLCRLSLVLVKARLRHTSASIYTKNSCLNSPFMSS